MAMQQKLEKTRSLLNDAIALLDIQDRRWKAVGNNVAKLREQYIELRQRFNKELENQR